MNLVLDLSPEPERTLVAEAAHLELALTEYALHVLSGNLVRRPIPPTGAEEFAYWDSESLIETRPEITDAPEHARTLRERA